MAENMIEIKDLSVEYRTPSGVVSALNHLDLAIEKGKTLGLVGETGAGKTTAALSILGLIPDPPGIITSGEIIFDGRDIVKMKESELENIRGKDISMIFQDPMTSLNPVMTVELQIAESYETHMNISRDAAVKKAREMLELVGIPAERGKEYPHQFSGGMKQRVVIAIALSLNPQLLIADEPTTALDVTIQAQVLELMRELKEKYEMSMLMITHDLGIVAEICDKVSIIYAGNIIEHGNLTDIFDNTRHPYTLGLFNSLPDLDNRAVELKPIKGLMPDPMDLPSGCPFHPRCDYAMDICAKAKPKKYYRGGDHYVICHLYESYDIHQGEALKK